MTVRTLFVFSFLAIVFLSSGVVQGEETVVDGAATIPLVDESMAEVNQATLAAMGQEERDWYEKFYKGVVFFDGWKKITLRVLEKYSDEEQTRALAFMQHLGVKIGAEWAKDNDIRKIDTEMLKGWGKQLKQAVKKEKIHLTTLLHRLDREVDERLSTN
ncbi:MAG: hypothetical protein ABFS19_09075 [Thermodesulfobacteriota bacterium]